MVKKITGYPNYTLSDKGVIKDSDGNIIEQHINDSGYLCAALLSPTGKRKIERLHRLIMIVYGEKIKDHGN